MLLLFAGSHFFFFFFMVIAYVESSRTQPNSVFSEDCIRLFINQNWYVVILIEV